MPISSRKLAVSLAVVVAITSGVYVLAPQSVTAQTGAGTSGVQVDTSTAIPVYANFARVSGTPDEVVINLGFFAQQANEPLAPIKVHHQVVMSYPTLKRLTASLQATLERHEATFGPIELDVNKRVRNATP